MNIKILLALLWMVPSSEAVLAMGGHDEREVMSPHYSNIDAHGLKTLMDSGMPYVLVDSRTAKYLNKFRLPGALWIPHDTPASQISQQLPDKNQTVVVFCMRAACPMSGRLAQRLGEMGYTHVIKFPGGIEEWRDVGGMIEEQVE